MFEFENTCKLHHNLGVTENEPEPRGSLKFSWKAIEIVYLELV
jgi:hypothetical protein